MAKITEYPRATKFDANDVLLKDGTNGTKTITVEDFVNDVSDTTNGVEGKLAKAEDIENLKNVITEDSPNLLEELWESGFIGSNGELSADSNSIRSKTYSTCESSTTYYGLQPTTYINSLALCWYNSSHEFISRDFAKNTSVTSPSGAAYFKVSLYGYGQSYRGDIAVFKGSTAQEYVPHLTAYDYTARKELNELTEEIGDAAHLRDTIKNVEDVATSGSPIEVFSVKKVNGGFEVHSALSNFNRNACYVRGTKLEGTTLYGNTYVCWDASVKRKASKMSLYITYDTDANAYEELTIENAPTSRVLQTLTELETTTVSVYRYKWKKTNFNTTYPFFTLRFCAVFYDANDTEICRMYSAQQTCRLINNELVYDYESYTDSQNISHVDALSIVSVNVSQFNTLDQGAIDHYYPITNLDESNSPTNIYYLSNSLVDSDNIYIAQRSNYALELNIRCIWTVLHIVKPETSHYYSYIAKDLCEPGACYQSDSGIQYNSTDHTSHRTRMMYSVEGNASMRIAVDMTDNISSILVNQYNSSFEYISTLTGSPTNGEAVFHINSGAKYIKAICTHSADVYNFHGIRIESDAPISACYNPNKGAVESYNSMPFNYVVCGNVMTSGRLLLPPNYSVNGDKVPLVVYVHGSSAMMTWNEPMQTVYIDYLRYLADEGYAIFDCYPWTNKYVLDGSPYSPIMIPSHIRSYIEGIKYVCSRFNVDIDSTVMLCKSQGGMLAEWAIDQTNFTFKAIALFAPAEDAMPNNNKWFYNANTRSALLKHVDFEGTTEELNAFVTSGDPTDTLVASFIEKNKAKIVGMMPWSWNIRGIQSYDDIITESVTVNDVVPQWMLDNGLPAMPQGAAHFKDFGHHSEYSKHATCPVKFWCAFDDESTSSYNNYAIYTWLLNGGSKAEFRILPLNSGGHHAMDYSPNALKSSGTTALGIAYTNIPTAYVEAAEFFKRNLVM